MSGKTSFLNDLRNSEKGKQPNVVLIVCDDLGKFEVSAYGSEHIETPNIDKLGSEGVIFQNAYVTSPICAASRAGLLTGRIQNRYGFETQIVDYYPANKLEYWWAKNMIEMDSWDLLSEPEYPSEEDHNKQGIPPSEINLAELLQASGYHTGLMGKWHLGYADDYLPHNRGFDKQYGFYGAFSLYTSEKEKEGIFNYEHDHFGIKHQWDKGRSGNGAIRENDEIIVEEQYLTHAIRDRSIQFIKENKERPFFLYCSFSAPHVPFQAPEKYMERYTHIEDPNKQTYYAMIAALDDSIGEIEQTLQQEGLDSNTLVIFISDNGGATYTEATDNGPYKGGKTTQFEGGINVPFIIKWKEKIEPGTIYSKPVSSTDIFTTVSAAAGIDLPKDREYDGVDLIPHVLGSENSSPHEYLYWRANHIWAIRDSSHKLILSTRDNWSELYDLKSDISEQQEISKDNPEIFNLLYNKHLEWQKSHLPKKPKWPNIVDYKTEIDGKTYYFPS